MAFRKIPQFPPDFNRSFFPGFSGGKSLFFEAGDAREKSVDGEKTL